MGERDQSSIFSTGGKFRPDYGLLLELHALTLVARSYALLDETMEVSNGVGVVKLLFQPVENKFILFLPAFNSHSQAPSSLQPGSLGMKHNMLMFCSLYYNDIAHLDPSASLICTMVVGREESTVTGSGIIGRSSLSSLSPPPTAPSSPPSPSSSPALLLL